MVWCSGGSHAWNRILESLREQCDCNVLEELITLAFSFTPAGHWKQAGSHYHTLPFKAWFIHLFVCVPNQVAQLIILTLPAIFIYVLINAGTTHMFPSIFWHKHIIYVAL